MYPKLNFEIYNTDFYLDLNFSKDSLTTTIHWDVFKDRLMDLSFELRDNLNEQFKYSYYSDSQETKNLDDNIETLEEILEDLESVSFKNVLDCKFLNHFLTNIKELGFEQTNTTYLAFNISEVSDIKETLDVLYKAIVLTFQDFGFKHYSLDIETE